MIRLDTPLCILDTETLGLDPAAPVWEFAGVRIDQHGRDRARDEFLIRHDPGNWLDTLPEQFRRDYAARYRPELAVDPEEAAERIQFVTDGAVIAGSNPSFDMQRLDPLLRANGIVPGWHYHPLDIPSMAVGWAARSTRRNRPQPDATLDLPWRSSQLCEFVGINPADFARHTAVGDVQWCLAQWRAMTGQAAGQ